MNTNIEELFICECNNKKYNSRKSLNSHKKTQIHIAWQNKSELKHIKIMLTEKDNTIISLKTQIKKLDTEIDEIKQKLSMLMFS